MDIELTKTAHARLVASFAGLIAPGQPESLYLGPIVHAALRCTNDLLASAEDAETRTVAQTTKTNLHRALEDRSFATREPIMPSYEIASLLRACVAGEE